MPDPYRTLNFQESNSADLESLKQQMSETLDDAWRELQQEELLLFLGWLEAKIQAEQEIAAAK